MEPGERTHKKRDGESHRSKPSRSHREKDKDGEVVADPSATVRSERPERSERRHRPSASSTGEGHRPSASSTGEDRERRRHGHREHGYREHGEGEFAEHERKDRGSERVDRERNRADRAAERVGTVQIMARPGAPKILASASSTPAGGEASRGGGNNGDSGAAAANGGPSPPLKKKQTFAMPATTVGFTNCRLLDEEHQVCIDAAKGHLLESSSEFTTVTCVGPKGVGKSLVLSLLVASLRGALNKGGGSRRSPTPNSGVSEGGEEGGSASSTRPGAPQPPPPPPPPPLGLSAAPSAPQLRATPRNEDADFQAPLAIHSLQEFLDGSTSPAGVDLCISALDRLLLLDTQPLFEYDTMSREELKVELQLVLFLTSICHTLLVVTDVPADLQLFKFLRLLAVLKLKVPDLATWATRGNGDRAEQSLPAREVLPRLVVAFNNIGQDELDDDELFGPVQAFLKHSPWKLASSIQCVRIPPLPGTCLSSLLLSEHAHSAGMRLREVVLAAGPERGRFGGKDGPQFTEREWLYHIRAYWDFVKKQGVLNDYFNIALQGLESYGWPSPL